MSSLPLPETRKGVGSFQYDFDEFTTSPANIFDTPYVDTLVLDGQTQEFYPINSISNDGPFDFYIPSAGEYYTYLPLTRLHGCFHILKIDSNGTEKECEVADDYSVVNNFVNSLFSKIEISANNCQLMDMSLSSYAYKSYLELLLSYGKESKLSFLRTCGFIKDGPTTATNNYTPTTNIPESFAGSGYNVRKGIVAKSKKFYFLTDLHSGFLRTGRYLVPGISLRFRLIRNNDSFTLMYKTGNFKIVIDSLKISVRRVTLSPNIFVRHAQLFSNKNSAIMPFKQSQITTHIIPTGSREVNVQIASGILPAQVYCGFVQSESFSGSAKLNPFIFESIKAYYYNFMINGKMHPASGGKFDFENDDYASLYQNLLDNSGIMRDNGSNDINMLDFKNTSTLYALSTDGDLCNLYHTHTGLSGTIDFNVSLKEATDKAYTLVVYKVFNKNLMIDQDRTCTVTDA